MDIRDYEYIVTIAEQKSITRAAAEICGDGPGDHAARSTVV